MADIKKKDDPTVASDKSASESGTHPARPTSEADDYAGDVKYREASDKPGPDSVVQEQVLED